MKTGDRRQETALRQAQGLTTDSKRKGMTMAEVDAYYGGLLKELEELQQMLNERTPVESPDGGSLREHSTGQRDNDG